MKNYEYTKQKIINIKLKRGKCEFGIIIVEIRVSLNAYTFHGRFNELFASQNRLTRKSKCCAMNGTER